MSSRRQHEDDQDVSSGAWQPTRPSHPLRQMTEHVSIEYEPSYRVVIDQIDAAIPTIPEDNHGQRSSATKAARPPLTETTTVAATTAFAQKEDEKTKQVSYQKFGSKAVVGIGDVVQQEKSPVSDELHTTGKDSDDGNNKGTVTSQMKESYISRIVGQSDAASTGDDGIHKDNSNVDDDEERSSYDSNTKYAMSYPSLKTGKISEETQQLKAPREVPHQSNRASLQAEYLNDDQEERDMHQLLLQQKMDLPISFQGESISAISIPSSNKPAVGSSRRPPNEPQRDLECAVPQQMPPPSVLSVGPSIPTTSMTTEEPVATWVSPDAPPFPGAAMGAGPRQGGNGDKCECYISLPARWCWAATVTMLLASVIIVVVVVTLGTVGGSSSSNNAPAGGPIPSAIDPSRKPSLAPSVSNMPSVTTSPSLPPSMSMSPSISSRPSFVPSTSLMPSISMIPSITPSETHQPSFKPSLWSREVPSVSPVVLSNSPGAPDQPQPI